MSCRRCQCRCSASAAVLPTTRQTCLLLSIPAAQGSSDTDSDVSSHCLSAQGLSHLGDGIVQALATPRPQRRHHGVTGAYGPLGNGGPWFAYGYACGPPPFPHVYGIPPLPNTVTPVPHGYATAPPAPHGACMASLHPPPTHTHTTPRRPIACLVDLPPPPPPSPPAASRRACHWIEPWFIPAMCAPPGRQSNRKLQDQLEQVACTQHIDVVEECGQQRTGQATSNRCVRTWVANAAEEQLGHDRQGFEASHRAKIQSTQSSQEFELVCKRILEICLFRVVWVRVLVKRRYTQSMDKRNRPP